MVTEAQARARRKYQREGTDSITIRYAKTQAMPEMIRQAADLYGIGPTQYVKMAIANALDRDGITQADTQPPG